MAGAARGVLRCDPWLAMIDRPIDDDVDFRPSSRLANSAGSKRRWRWLAPAVDRLGRR